MSWSNDTRCLFCDGKLPMFRKVSLGQFCSKVHQEAYWSEQNQLAVESLHRTHDALQAYKPVDSIESILGPGASVPESAGDAVPELQGLRSQPGEGRAIKLPVASIISADPVEYEIHRVATKPLLAAGNPSIREFNTVGGIVTLGGARASSPEALPPAVSMTAWMPVEEAQLVVSSPIFFAGLALTNLTSGGLLALREIEPGGAGRLGGSPEPVEFSVPAVRGLVHSLTPSGNILERIEREVFPLGETLLTLSGHLSAAGGSAVMCAESGFAEFPAAAVERPQTLSVTAQPLALAASAGLLGLGSIPARDPGTKVVGRADSIEPPAQAVALDLLRLAPVASDSMSDLLGETSFAPLLALDLGEAWGAAESPLKRPVIYQAFAVERSMRLPDSQQCLALLELQAQAGPVFPRDLAAKIQPRAGELRLRPGFVAAPLQGEVLFPKAKFEPVGPKSRGAMAGLGAFFNDGGFLNGDGSSAVRIAAGVVGFWRHAPRDLKLLLFAVPLALGLAFHPSLPKVSIHAPQADATEVKGRFEEALSSSMAVVRKSMAERAAVGLDENFRQGLDNWMSNSGSTAEWAFDQAGFVQPGRVALYQPSLGLSDYEFQFLGAIDQGALSWVARAVDFQNYYVVKLVVVKNGPVPQMGITRYAVINGKPVDRIDTPVTFSARTDSLYRVSMVMEGDHYSLVIQGQMIDSWTEPRLKRGGVGFFTNSGERSRIGWVQITHQYDMVGRLFAYLAP